MTLSKMGAYRWFGEVQGMQEFVDGGRATTAHEYHSIVLASMNRVPHNVSVRE